MRKKDWNGFENKVIELSHKLNVGKNKCQIKNNFEFGGFENHV